MRTDRSVSMTQTRSNGALGSLCVSSGMRAIRDDNRELLSACGLRMSATVRRGLCERKLGFVGSNLRCQ